MIYGYSSIHTCTYWYPLHVCVLYAMYALISTVTHRSWIDYMPGSHTHPTFTEWEPLDLLYTDYQRILVARCAY